MRFIGKPEGGIRKSYKVRTVISLLTLIIAVLWSVPEKMAQTRTSLAVEKERVISEGLDPAPRVELDYANVPAEIKGLEISREPLALRVVNNTSTELALLLEAQSISGGDDVTSPIGKLLLRPFGTTAVKIGSDKLVVSSNSTGFASQFLITGRVFDTAGRLISKTRAPSLYYHRDEAGVMYAYRTLVNFGIVGKTGRRIPPELLETLGKTDSIGIGKPGPAPNTEGIYRIDLNDYEFKKVDPVRPIYGSWVQVCVTLRVSYTDNGFGEDFFTNNTNKFVPGVWVRVRDNSNAVVFEGFTADGYDNNDVPGGDTVGCIPWKFTSNRSNWTVHVQSRAKVRFNNIDVFNNPDTETLTSWVTIADLNAGQNFISIPYETRESSTLAAAAHAIFLHNGGILSGNYKIFTGYPGSTSFVSSSTHKIYLADPSSRQKFIVAHELGHALLYELLGSDFGPYDGSHNAASPCDSPVTNSHTMASKEFNITAFHEGFADFYTVDTWNNHNQQDGVFVVWGIVYDADPPPGNIWMRYNCASPYYGYGNETDWMRFFWDFHTGGVSPHNPVSFNDIMGIIALASPLEKMGAYEGLRTAVQTYNLGVLWTTFFYWADMNGITY